MPQTVGIFGGTFDPVHYGHLRLAEEARECWPLDRLVFIPAQLNPLKQGGAEATPGEHRLEMLRLALADRSDCDILDLELRRPGPSFMVDTIRELRVRYPDAEFVLVLGMDAFRLFPRWKAWPEIVEMAHLLVGTRPGEEAVDPQSVLSIESPGSIWYDETLGAYRFKTGNLLRFYANTPLDIAATDIRRRIAEGLSIRYLTPSAVVEYIQKNGFYRSNVGR
jgi:nicotinate-nucleotide adenylyltransferase